LTALRDGRYEEAVEAAARCCYLDADQRNRQLLALAEFYCGRFATAARLAGRCEGRRMGEGEQKQPLQREGDEA
jgi:hypothetical protein